MPEQQDIHYNDLDISFNEIQDDYYVSPPVPPYKENHYVTGVAGVKLGFGARYYLIKALRKVKEMFPDMRIPLYELDLAPIPQSTELITRRRGQWLQAHQIYTLAPEKTKYEKAKDKANSGSHNIHGEPWEISEGSERSYEVINVTPTSEAVPT